MVGRQDFQNCFCFMPMVETNKYGFPVVKGIESVPEDATFINSEFARRNKSYDSWVMFYEYDWKFEKMWQQPKRQAKWLSNFQGAIAPQFSIYSDIPMALQIYSMYKSRWCSAYWESLGIPVIPCVYSGGERTYDWCFDGLPKHSVVSMGSMGNHKNEDDAKCWLNCFEEMARRLDPSLVLLYGAHWDNLPSYVPVKYITPSRNELKSIYTGSMVNNN